MKTKWFPFLNVLIPKLPRYKNVFIIFFTQFFQSHCQAEPFPGPPNVKNTPWRSSLSFTGNEEGLGFMIGTGGLSWACLKLWADSSIGTNGRCCTVLDGSKWFELGTVFARTDELSVTMLALEKTPGPWYQHKFSKPWKSRTSLSFLGWSLLVWIGRLCMVFHWR